MRIGLLATFPPLVAVLAGLAAGCTSTPPAPAPGATPGPAPAATAGPDGADEGGSTGTVMTDPAQGYRPAHELKFDGPAVGMVTVGRVDCSRLGPDTYSWVLAADLSGTPLQLKFDTNRYRGAGSYPLSGSGSVLTMKFGDRTAATDSSHTGTFTVDEDGETGSIEATLGTSGGQQRITGPWSCTGE